MIDIALFTLLMPPLSIDYTIINRGKNLPYSNHENIKKYIASLNVDQLSPISNISSKSLLAFDYRATRSQSEKYLVRVYGPGSPGTGIMIILPDGNYAIVTAKHVLSGIGQGEEITLASDFYNSQINISSSRVLLSKKYDIAVIRIKQADLPKEFKFTPITPSTRPPIIGEELYVSGYPLPTGANVSNDLRVTNGELQVFNSKPVDGYTIGYSSKTYVGMSGGGVFNEKGELIAIHGRGEALSTSDLNKTGTNYGVMIQDVLNWYREKPTDKDSESKDLTVRASSYILARNYVDALPLWNKLLNKYPESFIANYNVACLTHISSYGNTKHFDIARDPTLAKFRYMTPKYGTKEKSLLLYSSDPLVIKQSRIVSDHVRNWLSNAYPNSQAFEQMANDHVNYLVESLGEYKGAIESGAFNTFNEMFYSNANELFSNDRFCTLWVVQSLDYHTKNFSDPYQPDIYIRRDSSRWP